MFGHVDAGVLHVRPAIDMKDPAQERLIREVSGAVAALTQRYDGLLWGEHGKGVRSEYSPRFFGPLYPPVQAVKAAFDPHYQLNPGKIATPMDGGALLRVDGVPTRGAADRAIPEAVRARYDTAMHCNGNGACFNWDAADAMCPPWKDMRERRHSPSRSLNYSAFWSVFPSEGPAALRVRPVPTSGMDAGCRFSASCCQQPGQSGQVVGDHRQDEAGSHAFDATIDGLGHAADGLGPAESLLDALAVFLGQGMALVPGG
ncbi:FAD linked oxidases, C-terminal domain, partial [Roseomonas rosea]